ncbi:hypothetical protein BDV25DRAFT_166659 [Aspergillus avenaceus]|uniref:Uncharacterized protein n=1 Tax=Aspergillus avenaceus TaxID=36643 RepID=A0A5N6TEH8_ASPAV|nr:hypothetical protein BDV25DRAFT_166659 [Aspergillus avenaceus]
MSHQSAEPPKRTRRFLPEPIETSTRSSRTTQSSKSIEKNIPCAQISPEEQELEIIGPLPSAEHWQCIPSGPSHRVVEANNHHRVQGNLSGLGNELTRQYTRQLPGLRTRLTDEQNEPNLDTDGLQAGPRKFVPEVMETASRSFRRGLNRHLSHANPPPQPGSGGARQLSAAEYALSGTDGHVVYESPFSYSRLRQRQETRRHSFRIPDLPAIPSSGSERSEQSDLPSLPASPSISSRESLPPQRVVEDRRESCDERFSGYLLSLAARSAEKQLKEQALAAFPNEQVYQPVDHFAIDREGEEESSSEEDLVVRQKGEVLRYRRASSADLSWELEYMRQHKEEAVMRGRAMAGTQGLRPSSAAVPTYLSLVEAEHHPSLETGPETECQQPQRMHAKNPPMLGSDLIFPQSLSPETTFCESSTLTDPNKDFRQASGLWHANPHIDGSRGSDGLWMGTCKLDSSPWKPKNSHAYRTPPCHIQGKAQMWLNGVVNLEENVPAKLWNEPRAFDEKGREGRLEGKTDLEFNDGFVTQIYNYLSLGYPCVARYYDYELSSVSGMPVADLRRDDMKTDAKGYVNVTDYGMADTDGMPACVRWLALRLYINEWARQQPDVVEDDSSYGTWGVRERKGSWAG